MAEAILSDLAAGLVSKAGSLLLNEIVLLWGVKDELEKLKRTVSTIEAVLLHAEELFMENPQVKHWLGMLSEAMYDADDLLDEFSTEALRLQVMDGSKTSKKVRLFFSSSNQIAFGLKMAHKIKEMRERLNEIAANRQFHLDERSYGVRVFKRDPTHSSPPSFVIGRDQEKEEIVDVLLSPNSEENVSVVAIVGIGGLGKTTLTQLVYNADTVNNYFDMKVWVCVSDDFDAKLLVKNILESATREAVAVDQMDPLKNLLHEKVNGEKYLLVLDDVWNEDLHKWYIFKDLLAGGARGSKIVITTRSKQVAKISQAKFIHDIRGLSETEAWLLFQQMAFKSGQLQNPKLEGIGKEIAEKCCGVPLAIKTIGGMLSFMDSESEWLLFKEKELSTIAAYKNDILPILKLSYNHLPSHYKHCFAYCSLYPKDFTIFVDELINMWRAQGYLKSTNSNESLSDIGFGYFRDLLQLSFFQDVEKDDYGNIKYCKMHDLMHDLATSVAAENLYASHSSMTKMSEKTRHVSIIQWDPTEQDFSSILKTKNMRTLFSTHKYGKSDETVDAILRNLKCLRVLDLFHMGISTLPSSICKLKHLRYLDLSGNRLIRELPNSVSTLLNLQVLKLKNCDNLSILPENISKLVNLTNLENRYCHRLTHMPLGIRKMTQLEKLDEFVIAKHHSVLKKSGGLVELHSLDNLKGGLVIRNLRYVRNASEFTKASLSLKKKLQRLRLFWGWYEDEDDDNEATNEEMVMEELCPHPNLKELTVKEYRGAKPPSWLPSITHLVSVTFDECRNMQRLPPLDQLPNLKKLSLSTLAKLESIDVENGDGSSSFYPPLIDLTLIDCPNLRGFETPSPLLREELPCFPHLSSLHLSNCSNLTRLPLFPSLKKLEFGGDTMNFLITRLKMPTTSASQLQDLSIVNTEDSLDDEWLQCFPSLQSLMFRNCSFKTVCGDEKDDEIQWQSLKVLRSVEFINIRNLVTLPNGLQYVKNLQHLNIDCCYRLECIPEWMPKLIALQHLSIAFSPLLEERCKNNSAEDWPLISHIPHIIIEYKQIQRNGCYLL